MRSKIKLTRKDKYLEEDIFFKLLDDFIDDSYSGRRLKKNGSSISGGTITNYIYLKRALKKFTEQSSFKLKLIVSDRLTHPQKERASQYWRKFYKSFTHFLYFKLGYFDNYVGLLIKCLRSFLNYIKHDRNIGIGSYHKNFYVPIEQISIITLSHKQLNYIIYNPDFNALIKKNKLEKVKDIFVFGCTVALRVSDLLTLSRKNLTIQNGAYYLNVKSKKTRTLTSIKLPEYAVDILKKYQGQQKTLLPTISKGWLGIQLKNMGRLIPDNFEIVKTRERRGKQIVVYKDSKKRRHYKLADHLTTHTMRRTAITTMLNLGMPEHLVRKISGHAANSREFFRYVELSQSFIDEQTDRIFAKIKME